MIEERKKANVIEDSYKKAIAYENKVKPYLDEIRYHIDKLELLSIMRSGHFQNTGNCFLQDKVFSWFIYNERGAVLLSGSPLLFIINRSQPALIIVTGIT